MPYIDNFAKKPISNGDQPDNMIWLDYLVVLNPQSVMKVLSNYGYTGYLAPMDEEELREATYDFIERNGNQAVIELLKAHPLYEVISGICKEETSIKIPFKNASGEEVSLFTTLSRINYKKLLEVALIFIGTFYVADLIWKKFTK